MSYSEGKEDLVPDVSSDEDSNEENVSGGTAGLLGWSSGSESSPKANESQEAGNVTSQDLFGDADDISSSDSDNQADSDDDLPPKPSRPAPVIEDDEPVAEPEPDFPIFPDDDDEDGEVEPEPVTNVIEADMPIFPSMMNEQTLFVKMPNFLSVEPRAFDPDYYDEEVDEEELQDEEGRSRLKLKIENTIRWRYAKDANNDLENDEGRERESNARIVRWSDGSASLLLGSEVFDIHQTSLGSGDYSHLFVQQGTGLQGQAVFRNKLTFRPHSTDSHTHRKITMSIADRLGKTQKIRVLPVVGKDPDAHRTEMMKKEEERLRSAVRLENQQRRSRERTHTKSRPTLSFLEGMGGDDDDDDETSISAIKRGASSGKKPAKKPRPSSKPKKAPSSKKKRTSSDEDDEDEEEEDEDEEGYDDGDGFIDDGDLSDEDAEEEEEDAGEGEAEEEADAAESSEEEAPPVAAPPKKRKAPPVEKETAASQRKKKKPHSNAIISSSEDDSD